MGDNTKIEWTRGPNGEPGATWNPIRAKNKETGKKGWFCTKPSAGCKHCYAESMNVWRGNGLRYIPANLDKLDIIIENVDQPIRWKRPRIIFVCSMTDLFGEFVTGQALDVIFDTMCQATQHTFKVLTKRAQRMRNYLTLRQAKHGALPAHIHCGVTVENQKEADARREFFRDTPAAIKFVSYEPALGPVDWKGWEFVQQILAGGESGRDPKPAHPNWFRATRDFCQANQIAFHFKQWGQWGLPHLCPHAKRWAEVSLNGSHTISKAMPHTVQDLRSVIMCRVSDKKLAGRVLDGRTWDEMPIKTS